MRWLLLFLFVTGCAFSASKPAPLPIMPPMLPGARPQVMTAVSFAQPMAVQPPLQIGPTLVMVDKNDWHVVYPDGFPSTSYIWTVEVSTNLSGAWVDQPQEWYDDVTLLVHAPAQPWFMRLHGTTNTFQ